MNKVTFRIASKGNTEEVIARELPEDWSEVTAKQAAVIFPYVLHPQRDATTSIRLLQLLLDVPPSVFFSLPVDAVHDMIELCGWMYETLPSVSLMPFFTYQKKEYYLPKTKLENIMCIEYWLADEYYTNFLKTKDPAALNKLCAVLCRPKNEDKQKVMQRDDTRTPLLGRREAEERAELFVGLPDAVRLYVLAFFGGCKLWVHTTFSGDIFDANEEEEEGQTEKKDEKETDFGWYGTFQSVAENGVFGNLYTVIHETKFLELCVYLVRKKRQYDKQIADQNRRMAAFD